MEVHVEPAIRAQVASLKMIQNPRFEVMDLNKGIEGATFSDRFVVTQSFCWERLSWTVIFNAHTINEPPDVVFGQEDDSFQPLSSNPDDQSTLPLKIKLREWDLNNSDQLISVLLELRCLYLLHHRKLAEQVLDQRVRFELITMADVQGLEVLVVGPQNQPREVQFSVPVEGLDFTPLGQLLVRGALGDKTEANALNQSPLQLQVKFKIPQGSAAELKLMAAPLVLAALSLVETKLPGWTETTCLAEYLPVLRSHIQEQVEEAGAAMERRKYFFNVFPSVFGRPVEVDTVLFRKLTVFLVCQSFSFLVHLNVPFQFPKQQPSLVLQSSQHFDFHGKPITSRVYDDYPWSPRWEPYEMLRRMRDFLQTESANFKIFCSELQSQK